MIDKSFTLQLIHKIYVTPNKTFGAILKEINNITANIINISQKTKQTLLLKTRMVVHGQLVEPAVCLSDLYDVFLLDIIRDRRQNLWTKIDRSQ